MSVEPNMDISSITYLQFLLKKAPLLGLIFYDHLLMGPSLQNYIIWLAIPW